MSISLTRDIKVARAINDRIPSLELEIGKQQKKKVWFSMMSDYNLQETIQQMKRLKKLGIQKKNHDGDDD